MYKVKIFRTIYDGSTFEKSKNFAATIKEVNLPMPPFVGMLMMPFHDEIKKISVDINTQEISCSLSDYYSNGYPDGFDFQEKIDDDVRSGMTLVFNTPLTKT